MILPIDLPSRAQMERLLAAREPSSVSIYLTTTPSSRGDAERIELKNLGVPATPAASQDASEALLSPEPHVALTINPPAIPPMTAVSAKPTSAGR